MGKLTLTIGTLVEERTLADAKMQTVINAYLGDRAYVNEPDPDLGTVVRTELSNAQKAALFMDLLRDHIIGTVRSGYQAVKNRQNEAVVRQEAEAIVWQ